MLEILFARKSDVDAVLSLPSILGLLTTTFITLADTTAVYPASLRLAASTSVTVNSATPNVVSFERAALSGDASAPANSNTLTLATVNANVGSWGLAASVPQLIVNAKGLVTAAANVSIAITSSAVTDFTEAVQDVMGAILVDSGRIDYTYNDGANTLTTDIVTNSIGNTQLRQGIARSVIGVTGNAGANVADIQGTADQALVVNTAGTALAFGTVATGGITANAVTYAKMQQAATVTLLGNPTGGTANLSEITLNTTLSFTGTTLQRAALTGDATAPAGSNAVTVLQASTTWALPGDISPAQLVANTNDWAPTGLSAAAVIRFSTDASRDITGLTGGADGRLITLLNIGTQIAVLKNESASSTAANRLAIGADISMSGGTSVTLIYDSTSTRWRPYAGAGSGGGGTVIPVDVQVFTATGANTWTRPAGVTWVKVRICGAGGGGGGGSRQAAATATSGGTGGGGGYCWEVMLKAADAGASQTVTIGTGGTAGAAAGADTTVGGNGGAGGNSTFGSLITAFGGGAGLGANFTADASGGSGAGSNEAGGIGSSGTAPTGGRAGGADAISPISGTASLSKTSVFGGAAGGGSFRNTNTTAQFGGWSQMGGPGGGGGGGITAGNVAQGGGAGGSSLGHIAQAAGGATGVAGTSASAPAFNYWSGGGGGGGGGHATTPGAGGNGTVAGGGGGAGARQNGGAAVAGGTGGNGVCVVVSW